MAMRDVGIDVRAGSGVAAAQEHFRRTAAPLAKLQAAGSPDAQANAAAPKREPVGAAR